MKLLIVGQNSYISTEFRKLYNSEYEIDGLSVRDNSYKDFDYSGYDVIIYFAAIVHHPEIKDENLYFKVNSSIPVEIANIASKQGVKKFIYISTVAVWGIGPMFGKDNIISKTTPLIPTSLYGISKLEGEKNLLNIDDIMVSIIRLPNVYGDNCPGTFYPIIKKLAKLPIFPRYAKNYRMSMISVENVAKAINHTIKEQICGIQVPQDNPILSIQDRIKLLSNGKQFQTSIFTPFIYLFAKIFPSKYTNNLYGGFLIDINDFPTLSD